MKETRYRRRDKSRLYGRAIGIDGCSIDTDGRSIGIDRRSIDTDGRSIGIDGRSIGIDILTSLM
ncbi:MAG TPA: hypothetical protein PLZ52_00330 [Bacteroidales bacterium]|nr:hypothetical protein [Bacteroidales bacterium]HQL69820.1 hypothetical protein [Bacteroidales bacterium]